VDLFRGESLLRKTHWILLVMDASTRRMIGFGVQALAVDGAALCRMFDQATKHRRQQKRLGRCNPSLVEEELIGN